MLKNSTLLRCIATTARSPKRKRRERQLARILLRNARILRSYQSHHGSGMGGGGKLGLGKGKGGAKAGGGGGGGGGGANNGKGPEHVRKKKNIKFIYWQCKN